MSLYAGLSPKDALAKWYAIRQKPQNALTPEEKYDLTGGMTDLKAQNPAAWDAMRQGVNASGLPVKFKGGQTVSVFDPNTGTWHDQEEKSIWHDPETYMILGAAAGVVAPAVLGIAGAAAASAPLASTTTVPVTGALVEGGTGLAGAAGTLGGAAAAEGGAAATTAATTAAVTGGGAAVKPVVDAVTPNPSEVAPDPSTLTGQPDSPGYAPGNSGYDWSTPQGASLLQQLMKSGVGPAGISALTTLLGTHMQNSANADAAKTTADALKYSTDVQDAAAKRNEAFLRQQAESSYANTEATRRANYDQWRAREARVSNLGAALGLTQRDIPNYVPGVDPLFTSTSTTTSGTPPNIPGRATGGPVDQNQPYTVGENGPETFVPNQPGTVVPNVGWDPNAFAQIVGRAPTQAETNFYSKVPTWRTDVLNAAGGGKPTTAGNIGTGFKLPRAVLTPIAGSTPAWQEYPNGSGPGGPVTPPGGATPQPGGDLMSALTQNYASLGAKPTGPGSGPTDISYFARRIQETGGMTPQNIAYWFGPSGRIAQELAGSVPPEASGGASGASGTAPYLPPSSFTLGSFALNPRF